MFFLFHGLNYFCCWYLLVKVLKLKVKLLNQQLHDHNNQVKVHSVRKKKVVDSFQEGDAD